MKQARLLVLRGGAIGDFIVTLPALQALRERWPLAWIELIGYPHVARLAEIAGIVNHVQSLEQAKIARLFALKFLLPEEQVDFFQSFDVIVNFLHDPDGSVAEHLAVAKRPVILHASPMVESLHAVDHFLKPLESLAIYASGRHPTLRLPAVRPPRPVLAIHPGSGSPAKNWPAERFVDIARRAMAANELDVVIVLGEADDEAARLFDRELPVATYWRNLTLIDLAHRLAGATHYLGNDSGISHLAAALGLRSTVIFGPSNPDRWAPRGTSVQIVTAPDGDLAGLPADAVWAKMETP